MAIGIFEAGMLVCFAASWPFNLRRAWKARTAVGTSLSFMLIILVGYTLGIVNKLVNDDISYVIAFYVLDMVLVSAGVAIFIRNSRLDKLKAVPDSRQR